jgi:hypothetical protein
MRELKRKREEKREAEDEDRLRELSAKNGKTLSILVRTSSDRPSCDRSCPFAWHRYILLSYNYHHDSHHKPVPRLYSHQKAPRIRDKSISLTCSRKCVRDALPRNYFKK